MHKSIDTRRPNVQTVPMRYFWFFLIGSSVTLAGCANIQYHPYIGQQQDWQTSTGGFANEDYSIPIFDGFPPQPYHVLGALKVTTDQRGNPDQWAAGTAHQHHADALMFLNTQSRYVGTLKTADAFAWAYGNNSGSSSTSFVSPQYRITRTYVAIQFITTNTPP